MASQVDGDALRAVARGNMGFAANLYDVLSGDRGNLFFSPISIEVILALASTGARGATANQMIEALKLPKDRYVIEAGFHSIMESLKSTENMTLEIANKLFGQESFPFEKDFMAVAEKSFLSGAEEMDFAKDPEGCRRIINQWAEERTNNKITDVIPEGTLNSLTRLVLVNAIYFKGKWESPFDDKNTYLQRFHISRSESREVKMMHIKKRFGYAERDDLKSKVLVMPYVGNQISMVILLPNDIEDMPHLESKLNVIDMAEVMKSVSKVEVEVTLPRFKLETSIDLNDPLISLGMVNMFDPMTADFSGISKTKGLYVSKVLQKAFIEVNEEGTEAAAVTGKYTAQLDQL